MVLEVYRFIFHREVLPFSIWFYPTLLDSAYPCRDRCYDSNEPKIIENGVPVAKDMPVFVLHILQFFRAAEVPARRPEIPAQAPEVPAHVFI